MYHMATFTGGFGPSDGPEVYCRHINEVTIREFKRTKPIL